MQKRHIIDPHLIGGIFNQLVDTPLGKGWAFGRFILKNTQQESSEESMVVRLPLNDTTREHLKDPNCLTPKAERCALFTFPFSEGGQGWAEWLIIAALLVLVVVLGGNVLGWPW